MIVNAVTAAALTLDLVGNVADKAVVVVYPHDGHVVGHFETVVVDRLHFLVGNEHHEHVFERGVIQLLAQDLTLIFDDGLHE